MHCHQDLHPVAQDRKHKTTDSSSFKSTLRSNVQKEGQKQDFTSESKLMLNENESKDCFTLAVPVADDEEVWRVPQQWLQAPVEHPQPDLGQVRHCCQLQASPQCLPEERFF